MRNCIQADDRSLALSLRVGTLTQEFEELQRLRGRVRRAEAKNDLRLALSVRQMEDRLRRAASP